jgi:CPA1 family monovalent cation:H+ antiporter
MSESALPSGLELQQLIRRVPQFASGSFEARDAIVCCAHQRRTTPGESVIKRGSAGDALFFIVEGTFEAQLKDLKVEMRPGEFFGEIGLLFGERTATVVSKTDGLLLVVPGEFLPRVYDAFPQIQPILDRAARERLKRS